jgi:hypothetical protein
MGKRRRKSNQSPLLSSPKSPNSTVKEVEPKRGLVSLPPETNIPTSGPEPPLQDSSISDTCPPQVNKKLWNRFYEPLVLLAAYGKSQGNHVKSDEETSEEYISGNDDKTLKKRFLDELAYVCDYSPSGDTVAAIAIEDRPQLIYWVAANRSQGPKVKPFLSHVLLLLGQVYNASEDQIVSLKQQLSNYTMSFSDQKLQRYRHMLKEAVKNCLPILAKQNEEGAY